ncbi:NADH-quinone oxidoreductase subunit C [Bacteriovorax sp. Seq25_V]|uniref:NADH-quinone oxidoreductase subunit D-related protein n=1 Tax=Bacteriovorax sp. Seq25_V TaxID=1201288 RepID=UPI000389E525|nr:NADH-quinone oxidoreductase subunit C [Bacteriovorax sp. Seq25_V]EQC46062.1 hypothetical protein M900_1770 [Bacteriovorax sp. Seq25_V]
MIVKKITDSLKIHRKDELADLFAEIGAKSSISCVGVTCLDLLNSSHLKNKYGITESRYLLIYIFHDLEKEQIRYIGCPLLFGQTMQSYSQIWSSLFYQEKEVYKNFGITFYVDERIQHEILEKDNSHFLEKDFVKGDVLRDSSIENDLYDYLNVNLHEYGVESSDVSFEFLTNGKNIQKMKVSQDSPFIGLEKRFEKINISDYPKYISHFNIYTPFSYQLLWFEVQSYLKGTTYTQYLEAKKMLFLEISRLYEHIQSLKESFLLIDEKSANELCESIQNDFYMLFCQIDSGRPYPIITNDFESRLPEGWLRKCIELLQKYGPLLEKLKSSIVSLDRIVKKTMISNKTIHPLKAGLSGLGLRSFGVSYDIRKNQPFYLYDQLELKVPLGISGSSYDRLLIRLEEVLEVSSNIVRLVEGFPVFSADSAHFSVPHFEEEEILFATTENAHGDISFIMHSLPSQHMMSRFHVINPSLRFLYSFENFYSHTNVDLIAMDWVTLGLNISEVVK